jgi:hypothetical protein
MRIHARITLVYSIPDGTLPAVFAHQLQQRIEEHGRVDFDQEPFGLEGVGAVVAAHVIG